MNENRVITNDFIEKDEFEVILAINIIPVRQINYLLVVINKISKVLADIRRFYRKFPQIVYFNSFSNQTVQINQFLPHR
jgi:hypothetical protein